MQAMVLRDFIYDKQTDMKTLQLIFMAAAMLVMASCDDESMNLDKARVGEASNNGKLSVVLHGDSYLLSWKMPDIRTDKESVAIVGKPESLSYDVWLVSAVSDTSVYIKTVDSCSTELSFSEVEDALDQFDDDVSNYRFGVSMANTSISNTLRCYSPVLMVDSKTVNSLFEAYNYWFFDDLTKKNEVIVNEKNEVVIESKSNGELWNMQFCNVFRGLRNQAKGKHFKLSFDIKWVPDKKTYKTPSLMIYTAKYAMKNGLIAFNEDLQWNETNNTQLIFDEGFYEAMNRRYVVDTKWGKINYEGTIGEMGADIIAIQINLSGYNSGDEGEIMHPNDNGTFYIRNIEVEIDGEVVAEYFMENNTYYDQAGNEVSVPPYRLYINGKDENGYEYEFNDDDIGQLIEVNTNYVTDGNYRVAGYGYGDTAIITVKDGNGYRFRLWDNGSSDKTIKIPMYEKKVYLTAYFELVRYNISSFARTNRWFMIDYTGMAQGTMQNGVATISVGSWQETGVDPSNTQLCILLSGFKEQVKGNKFSIQFDVTWNATMVDGSDEAEFYILSGKSIDSNSNIVGYQWDPNKNTEIIFKGGFYNGFGQAFIAKNKPETYTWGGTIGERGGDCIGIQINLSGNDYTNEGTFVFKNIKIFMGDKQVW